MQPARLLWLLHRRRLFRFRVCIHDAGQSVANRQEVFKLLPEDACDVRLEVLQLRVRCAAESGVGVVPPFGGVRIVAHHVEGHQAGDF